MRSLEDVRAEYGPPGPARRQRLHKAELHLVGAQRLALEWARSHLRSGWEAMKEWFKEVGDAQALLWSHNWLGDDNPSFLPEQLLEALADHPSVLHELRCDLGLATWVEPCEPLEFTRDEALYADFDSEAGF